MFEPLIEAAAAHWNAQSHVRLLWSELTPYEKERQVRAFAHGLEALFADAERAAKDENYMADGYLRHVTGDDLAMPPRSYTGATDV